MAPEQTRFVENGEEVAPALQEIADRLAASIGRPVDIDDHRLRLLAHSSHSQQVDPVRLASILNRSAPSPVIEHLRRIGLEAAKAPLRVPAAPELGMEARLCVPIRGEHAALGYLWLLDDGTIDEQQVALATSAAADAASLLERARLLRVGLHNRTQALVLEAMQAPSERASQALAQMQGEGLLAVADRVRIALVRECKPCSLQANSAALAAAIGDAVAAVRRVTSPREAVFAIAERELIILLAGDAAEKPERVFERLLAEHRGLVVGVGPLVAEGAGLAAARAKAGFAAGLAGEARLASWEQLGPYRYLLGLPERVAPLSELEPAVAQLAKDSGGRELLLTLECFLDLAGQAREAAAHLNLHRSSLYHRLGRIEELLGVDLHDGVQRLDAHLAVKAARVQGLLGP